MLYLRYFLVKMKRREKHFNKKIMITYCYSSISNFYAKMFCIILPFSFRFRSFAYLHKVQFRVFERKSIYVVKKSKEQLQLKCKKVFFFNNVYESKINSLK